MPVLSTLRSLFEEVLFTQHSGWHPDLRGADFSNTELKGASYTIEQFDKTKSLKGATMPDGSIYE